MHVHLVFGRARIAIGVVRIKVNGLSALEGRRVFRAQRSGRQIAHHPRLGPEVVDRTLFGLNVKLPERDLRRHRNRPKDDVFAFDLALRDEPHQAIRRRCARRRDDDVPRIHRREPRGRTAKAQGPVGGRRTQGIGRRLVDHDRRRKRHRLEPVFSARSLHVASTSEKPHQRAESKHAHCRRRRRCHRPQCCHERRAHARRRCASRGAKRLRAFAVRSTARAAPRRPRSRRATARRRRAPAGNTRASRLPQVTGARRTAHKDRRHRSARVPVAENWSRASRSGSDRPMKLLTIAFGTLTSLALTLSAPSARADLAPFPSTATPSPSSSATGNAKTDAPSHAATGASETRSAPTAAPAAPSSAANSPPAAPSATKSACSASDMTGGSLAPWALAIVFAACVTWVRGRNRRP